MLAASKAIKMAVPAEVGGALAVSYGVSTLITFGNVSTMNVLVTLMCACVCVIFINTCQLFYLIQFFLYVF